MDNHECEALRFDVAPAKAGTLPMERNWRPRRALIGDDDTVIADDAAFDDKALAGDGRYHENTLVNTRSYRCVGRLWHMLGDDSFMGSAFTIGPRLIMSAAHNFHAGPGGPTYTNFLFEPGYPAAQRSIPVDRFWVAKAWIQRGGIWHDFAFARTTEVIWPDLWYGVYGNVDDPPGWAIHGYPGEGGFDGTKPFVDMGSSTLKPWNNGSLRFSTMACDKFDLGGGVSGGPWIGGNYPHPTKVLFPHAGGPAHSGAYAGGLHSGRFSRKPDCAGSPQFGAILENFLNGIRNELP